MKKKSDIQSLKWVIKVAGTGNKWVLALLAARIAQGLTGVWYALLLGQVIDGAVSGNKQVFFARLLWFGLLILTSLILQALTRYLTEKSTTVLTKNFRSKVFGELLTREYSQVHEVHTGRWMNRLTSDVSVVVNAWTQLLPGFCGTLVRLLSAVAALLFMLPQLVYLLLPAGLVMAAMSLAFRKKLKYHHNRIQELDGGVRSFLQERLGSLLVLRSFTREKQTKEKAEELMEGVSKAKMRRVHFVNFCSLLLHGAVYGAQVLGVAMCGWHILGGRMSYGEMSAILYLVSQMEVPLANISGYLPQYYAMVASAERLMEPESFRPDVEGEILPKPQIQDWYARRFAALAFENVNFAYEDDGRQVVLQDLSLEIRKGEFVAFTGESGCGKSTAMKLMLGLYPLDGGSVSLVETDGSRQKLDGTWRKLFAYVPQGNHLISGTIRQALTLENEAEMQKEEKLWKALEVACADEFVRQQPLGLDAPLGERGNGLSEGQLQRLAIARAVISKRPILLLDEATSALDAATEAQVLENLRTLSDRTVVLISHRAAALDVCRRQIRFSKNGN